jgi:hypothetical protein
MKFTGRGARSEGAMPRGPGTYINVGNHWIKQN